MSTVLARAIEAGGDTDTIASITGQIAGTVTGYPSDSSAHFSSIINNEEIMRVAEAFAQFLITREEQAASRQVGKY